VSKILLKFIDLFCGIGAFHQAIINLKNKSIIKDYKCILSCDIDKDAKETYQKNFDTDLFINDVKDVSDINNTYSLLCAGFPCQPFSISGNKRGFNDERAGLFFKVVDIVKKTNPNFIIIENSPRLIRNSSYFSVIQNELDNAGYNVNAEIINSNKFATPKKKNQRLYSCYQ